MLLPNYDILETIAENRQSAVFKACHKRRPGHLLALKIFKDAGLSACKQARFKQKIEQLKVLQDPQILTPSYFGVADGICYITQGYFYGVSLHKMLEACSNSPGKHRMALDTFFSIACKIARALHSTHEAGIVHGGIKPNNILVNPRTLDIRLIDFIRVMEVQDASHFIYDQTFVRETLSYTSPEQTGRISHRVVFSSDLYSLGIVFYELLTGRPPFTADDPLTLIHSHLAEEALPAFMVNPDVPYALSRIIAKLMIKEPEKRYQSSKGLLADLVRSRDEYASTGKIYTFPLESCFYPHRASFTSRMVGRDPETGIIHGEFEAVTGGAFRALFVSGPSGIGKTRLIQELQKPLVRHKGYFTSGKFDVHQKNIPYSSLIQALRNLVRTFLSESNERVAHWKKEILKAVEHNGRVLTEVIPELEILTGPQPKVQPLPSVEAMNRFHDTFDRFLTCLASEEHPLILFIDDLQWCDEASFDFLKHVFTNHDHHPYLFFLGAYRDHEVDESHPLSKLIRQAGAAGCPLREIRLEPLPPEHCHQMVSYILDAPLAQTKALADFIGALSEGNPLFISESLSYLYSETLLYLDENKQWSWDLNKIRGSFMPTNIAALFSSKIRKLPPRLIALLEYCACLGNTFSPVEVASICSLPLAKTYAVLKPALHQGLLLEQENRLRFVHDRVQEAVLAAIPEERRRRIHWQVGRHLLGTVIEAGKQMGKARDGLGRSGTVHLEAAGIEKIDNLFAIVSHLNLGKGKHLKAETLYFLADLNYHAGNKALKSLAVEAARKYFAYSRELLPDDCWQDDRYERTFEIYRKAVKTELMCGNYAASEKLLGELLDHAKTDLDRAECLAEQSILLSSTGKFGKAIEAANRGLTFFGKAIPDNPLALEQKKEELIAAIVARENDLREKITNLPFAGDRKSKVEHKFYSELPADLYLSGQEPQMYLVAAQALLHCLSAGMDEAIIYALVVMGIYFAEQGDFEKSFMYEDLTRALAAKYPHSFAATKGMVGIAISLMHSRSHPRDIVEYSLKAITCGKNCGDLSDAALAYGPLLWNLLVQGADLQVIEEYARECLQFAGKYNLSVAAGLAEAVQAGWVEPMKPGCMPPNMAAKLKRWKRDHHTASIGSYYILKGAAYYYLGEHAAAWRCLGRAGPYLSGLANSVLKRQWYLFRVLSALKLYEQGASFKSEQDLMAEIKPLLEKIERWAALGPLLQPYLAFVHAELARVNGSSKEAMSLYLDAISTAHEQGYTFLEGHLYECLGELLRQAGRRAEKIYFIEALRLYRRCRAARKAIDLLEKYPEYFEEEKNVYPHFEAEEPPSHLFPDLDLEYLMKSSLAIAAEIKLDALLKKIMNVVLESSGAQHGYLLMEEKGDLLIRAESHAGREKTVHTFNRKLDDAHDICKAIVRYVFRTGEKVLLDHACRQGPFKDNVEVQDLRLRSVLCLPVIKQSKLSGVLYLENRLAGAIFTPEKTRITELLASQAAISLENARLVEEMKKTEEELRQAKEELEIRVRERTAELARANELLQKDIAERKRVEKAMQAERRRFNNILEILPAYLVLLTPDYHVPFANRLFRERFGDSGGRPCYEFLFGYDQPCENCETFRVLETMAPHEWEWRGPDGRDYYIFDFPFTDVDGSTLIMEVGIDITARKKAEAEIQKLNRELEQRVNERTAQLAEANRELLDSEARLRAALHEKETLLKEIHHRVKNNLQIIYSLLTLQLPYIKDEQAVELFQESRNRIYSMALIHEKLYKSESLAKIDLAEYLGNLLANLWLSYGVTERTIKREILIEDITLSINRIIPCALIINELVSNSLKHAFPEEARTAGTAGRVRVTLRHAAGGEYILTVSDNGVGLPEGFAIQHSKSLGLKLVDVLVKQLNGTIHLRTGGWTEFIITFPNK